MTALKIIGILLLLLLLLGFLRLGAIVSFGETLRVRLRVGALKLTVYPRKARKRRKKPGETKPEKEPAEKKEKKQGKKRSLPKPTVGEFLDLLDTALTALGETARRACRRVRVDPLELTLVAATGDPAETAILFGTLNTAVFTLMPKAEETFYLPDPSIRLRMDFDRGRPSAKGSLGLSLRVCDLFAIIFTLLLPLAGWFLRFRKAHRHDKPAAREPRAAGTKDQKKEDTEERIA